MNNLKVFEEVKGEKQGKKSFGCPSLDGGEIARSWVTL
jgi:hypothetical protein